MQNFLSSRSVVPFTVGTGFSLDSLLHLATIGAFLVASTVSVHAQGSSDSSAQTRVSGASALTSKGGVNAPNQTQWVRLPANAAAIALLGVASDAAAPVAVMPGPAVNAAAAAAPGGNDPARDPRRIGAVTWINTHYNYTGAGIRSNFYSHLPVADQRSLMKADYVELLEYKEKFDRLALQMKQLLQRYPGKAEGGPFAQFQAKAEWISIYAEGVAARLLIAMKRI